MGSRRGVLLLSFIQRQWIFACVVGEDFLLRSNWPLSIWSNWFYSQTLHRAFWKLWDYISLGNMPVGKNNLLFFFKSLSKILILKKSYWIISPFQAYSCLNTMLLVTCSPLELGSESTLHEAHQLRMVERMVWQENWVLDTITWSETNGNWWSKQYK